MAAEKTTKRRRKAAEEEPETPAEARAEDGEEEQPRTGARRSRGERARAAASEKPKAEPRSGMLRLRSDPRKERRFEPTTSTSAWISVLGLSIGSVVLGAGVYGQWLRASMRPGVTEPHPYAAYLLMAGALVLAAVALFGPRQAKPVRVGDAGVGIEKDPGEIERLPWHDVTSILVGADTLSFQGSGTVIAISLKQHAQAAARALAEARERIPGKLEDVDTGGVPALDRSAGEVVPLERAQLAGARCKASDELIAFEKDARLCGRCGEIYHKAHVPDRCLTCEAPLK